MRVFVTGASGFIGSAVVPELLAAGHTVLGLARSDASASALRAAGADVLRGDLEGLAALRAGAVECDGVIHLAFVHDFANFAAAAQTDVHAIEALGTALAGSNKPLVIASGLLGVKPGEYSIEADEPAPTSTPRTAGAAMARSFAERGVRVSIVRLPPTVHDRGDKGFIPMMIDAARNRGAAAFIGDGAQRWPAVHRKDAAVLFRRALESAPAGATLHAVGDEGVSIRQIAEVIGRKLGVPVTEAKPEELGFIGMVMGLDSPARAPATEKLLAWKATHPGLLADLEANYFA